MTWGYFTPSNDIETFEVVDSNILEEKFTSGVKEHDFANAKCDFVNMLLVIDSIFLKLVRFDIQHTKLLWLRETHNFERHEPLNLDTMSTLSIARENKYHAISIHKDNADTIYFDLNNMIMKDKDCIFNIMCSPSEEEKEQEKEQDQYFDLNDKSIPNEYKCPISSEIMVDPVVASDGYTYERRCIQRWITCNKAKSPMTNMPLKHLVLFTNNNIKSMIKNLV